MKLMRNITQTWSPFRVIYLSLLFLLTLALTLVLTLNAQKATASNLAAQTALGTAFTYQGQLNDGNNLASGTYDFQFSLFDVETGGTALGAAVSVNGVNVQQGVFSVKLDFGASAFTGAPRWLAIGVRPASTGDFAPLNPRQAISPAPYAIYADSAGNATNATNATNASNATTATTANSVPWTGITGMPDGFKDGVDNSGGSGITAVTAGAGLIGGGNSGDLTLGVNFAGDGAENSVARSDHSHTGQTWTTPAKVGLTLSTNATNGLGIFGRSQSSDVFLGKASVGILGLTNAPDGNGLEGDANAVSGQSFGVAGYSVSPNGLGVYGTNSAVGGRGVQGDARAATGSSYGVEGYSQSPQGLGVFGYNSAIGGTGIEGDAVATSGHSYGVYGYSQSPQGVGIYGFNAAKANGGLAGYFDGPVTITGKLTNGAGSFKVDHPLEPTNKYLYHSAVESPDMMNIYNGNVQLDAKGEALVQLPAWFEALNMEFRYQLTAIGAPGPNLYIAQEIVNNQFKIAGGAANMKVSWQVTGIRHDPYAQANRVPVEEDKPVEERGTYLYPAEYGQPAARGLYTQPARAQIREMTSKAASTQSGPQEVQSTDNK